MAASRLESSVSFGACCDFFEALHKEVNKQKKLKKLQKFLDQCRSLIDRANAKSSLFPVVRLILPQLDRERGAYGIKETLLAKLFIDLLKLGPQSSDAKKLKNYRGPAKGAITSADFGSVLFEVTKDRGYDPVRLSVEDINRQLDALAVTHATDGRSGVERILLELFKKMSGVQMKWFVRVILKDMRLGLGQNAVFGELHPDAKDLFDVNANLAKVCETLKDVTVRLNEIEISLFDPFRPMLAERGVTDLQKVADVQLKGKSFYIEVKYDGERMQLHKNRDKYRFFSRNGHDFTEDFGATPRAGNETKFVWHLHQALNSSIQTLVLDGEICAYNYQTDTVSQKGEQMNIRHLKADDPTYQQCLYIYDLLLFNDTVMANKPLHERVALLKNVLPEAVKGRVYIADRKIGSTKKDIAEALNDAIDRREEGIVLKDPDSVYKPNARGGGGWLKIKPEYNNELMDQCDLVVMGGYYGKGNRMKGTSGGAGITHFLLGVADKVNGVEVVRSFTRVGSGYSYVELFDLLKKLDRHFVKTDKKTIVKIANMRFGRELPDVWIAPEKSVVLQVKGAEIISSDTYDVSCTLR